MKFAIKKTTILLLIIGLMATAFAGCESEADIYETADISCYGEYIGNYDDTIPTNFISSFFPEKIENYFSDITYHYKAKKFDTCAYECYLEFVIEDKTQFEEFLSSYVNQYQNVPFSNGTSFSVFPISNVLRLVTPAKQNGAYAISYAEIGNILYSVDDQKIIFMALGVYDGGGTDTSELSYFINKFQIDVLDYQNNAFYTHDDQELEITFKERNKQ